MSRENIISKLEAMLFASGEPVEASKLAELLELDIENVTKMLAHLGDLYDERNSGICLVRIDGKYQLCTREEYADDVRALLEIKKNTPLSQAAFEVLAIVAYNKKLYRTNKGRGLLGPCCESCSKRSYRRKGQIGFARQTSRLRNYG